MIDPGSQKFMEWFRKNLEDDEFYNEMLVDITLKFDQFYNQPKEQVIQKLFEKLRKGAEEHGDPLDSKKRPKYNSKQLKEMLEEEFLDMAGYYGVEHWCKKHEKNKN